LHLWGCVIGKAGQPEKNDDAAIQQYVDLRAEDTSIGFCQAISIVSASMGGDYWTNYWRLKKKIPRKEKRGQLPEPRSRANRTERYTAAVMERYRLRDAEKARAREEHSRTVEEAVSRGIDIHSQEELPDLLQKLDRSKSNLEILLSSSDFVFDYLDNRGITNPGPQEVAARIEEAFRELEDVKKKIEVADRLLRLRRFLGLETWSILPHI